MLTFNNVEYINIDNQPKLKLIINVGNLFDLNNNTPNDPGPYQLVYSGGISGSIIINPDYINPQIEILLDLNTYNYTDNINLTIYNKCNIIEDSYDYNHCQDINISKFDYISNDINGFIFRITNNTKPFNAYVKWISGVDSAISNTILINVANNQDYNFIFTTTPPQSGVVVYELYATCSLNSLIKTTYENCNPIINNITINYINQNGITELVLNGSNLLPKNNNQNTDYKIKITQVGLNPNPLIVTINNVNLILGNTGTNIILKINNNTISKNKNIQFDVINPCFLNDTNNIIKTTNYQSPPCITSTNITNFNFNIIKKSDGNDYAQILINGNFNSPANFRLSYTNINPNWSQQPPNQFYNRMMSGGITELDLNNVINNQITEILFDTNDSTNFFYGFKNDSIGNQIKLLSPCNDVNQVIASTTWINCNPIINSVIISSKDNNGNDKIYPSVQLYVKGTNLLPYTNGTIYKIRIIQGDTIINQDITLIPPGNSNTDLYITIDTTNFNLDLTQDVLFEIGSPCPNNIGNTLTNGTVIYQGKPSGKCATNVLVTSFELHNFYLNKSNQGFIGTPPIADWHFYIQYSITGGPATYYVVVDRETNCPTNVTPSNAQNLTYGSSYVFANGQNQILNLSASFQVSGCDLNTTRKLTNLECPYHLYGIKNIKRCYSDFKWRIRIYCQKLDYDNNLSPIGEMIYTLEDKFKPNFNLQINQNASNKGKVNFDIINLNVNEGIPLNINYFIVKDNNQIISNVLTMNYNYTQSILNNNINVNGLLFTPPSTGFVNYKICAYYCTENTGSGLFPYNCPENLIKCSNLVQL